MKKPTILFAFVGVALLLASCQEKNDYSTFTPTIGVEVQGGTSGMPNDPITISGGSNYKPYSGGAYWGDEGRAANTHYTPYSEREHDYNYYRGTESDD